MECRTIELTIVSAQDLKKASIFSKIMHVYAVVSLIDSHNHYIQRKHTTPTDKTGNKNPRWNFPIKFTVNDSALHSNRLTLHFEIFNHHALLPDTLIGEVHVPASDLLASVGKPDVTHLSYQVRKRSSNKPKGVLNLTYKFGDKFTSVPPPPPPHPSMMGAGTGPSVAYAYPAQPAYAYPAPAPVNGYGYGYGYGSGAQVMQPQGRRNNFGMGMGAGLLGGALAGLVVGDLVSDFANDGGYYDDGGFDDGGFDFGGF